MAKHWYRKLRTDKYTCDIDWAECIYERMIDRRLAGSSKIGMKHHPKTCKGCPIYDNWKSKGNQQVSRR